jgi:PAS domain-containing protein
VVDVPLRIIGEFDAPAITGGIDAIKAKIAQLQTAGKLALGGLGQSRPAVQGLGEVGEAAGRTGDAIQELNLRGSVLGRMFSSLALGPMIGIATAFVTLAWSVLSGAKELRALEREAEKAKQTLLDNIKAADASKTAYAALSEKFASVTRTGKATEEQIGWLRDRVQELADANPRLVTQLGYSIDAEGHLVTATGGAITTVGDLQGAFNAFSSASFQGQINQAIQSLANFISAKGKALGTEGGERWRQYGTRGAGRYEELMQSDTTVGRRIGITLEEMQDAILTGARNLGDYITTTYGETFGEAGSQAADAFSEEARKQADAIIALIQPPTPPFPAGGGGGGGGAGRNEPLPTSRQIEEALILIREQAAFTRSLSVDGLMVTLKAGREGLANVLGLNRGERTILEDKPGLWLKEKISGGGRAEWLSGLQADKLKGIDMQKAAAALEAFHQDLNAFVKNFADVLSRFISDFGWSGRKPGKQDWMGLAQGLGQPLFKSWGTDIAGMLGLGKEFFGPMGSVVGGLVGWGINRLFGDKPLEIKQPVDIRIVDIETRLLNFFNFRGMEAFSYSSSFRKAFEGGLY